MKSWDLMDIMGGAHLLDGTLGLEEDAAAQQLREDAAYRPDVNGVGIVAAAHEDLWSSVVLSHHFLGHVPRFVRLLHPSQAKVADLRGNVGGKQRYFLPLTCTGPS